MNSAIERMLQPYRTDTLNDRKNATKEIMQEIVLCGLSRAGFFDHAAFYGGTALRIFHGLDRFSEDLDFSLMAPDPRFDLAAFFPTLEKEVRSFGLRVCISRKEKARDSDIRSAFVKGNTREHLLLFYPDEDVVSGTPADEKIKIKFEIDVNPPAHATFERSYRLLPTPYEINLYDMPSLFAGKIHAVLCRGWKSRVKGRDLYDYVFYLAGNASVNLAHLNARLQQTGFIADDRSLSLGELKQALFDRFDAIDFPEAARDVDPFLADSSSLRLWGADFFKSITENLTAS